MTKRLRADDQLGKWKLISPLGGGGNGEVWEARSTDGQQCALKALSKPGQRYRLDRFHDEVKFLLDHPETPGILRLIDHDLDPKPGLPPWYAMPIATPLRAALGTDPSPTDVLSALRPIAETLADLVLKQVSHRDIKPDNLFILDGEPVIGDFGLVMYPDKEPRTEHGRKLGPVDYMAPEMRSNADTAKGEPADTWALAKTLWVLLADEDCPLPGPHIPSEPACALSQRLDFTWANELDSLIERSTRMNPQERDSLEAFCAELRACLSPPPEQVATSSITDIQERISALTSRDRQEAEEAQLRRLQTNTAWMPFEQAQTKAWNDLAKLTGLSGPLGTPSGVAHPLLRLPGAAYAIFAKGGTLSSPGSGKVRIHVEIAMGKETIDSSARVAAVINVGHWYSGLVNETEVVKEIHEFPIGSAQEKRALWAVEQALDRSHEAVLRTVAEILAISEDVEPEWYRCARGQSST